MLLPLLAVLAASLPAAEPPDAFFPEMPRRICTWAVVGPIAEGDEIPGGIAPADLVPSLGEAGWRYFDDRLYCRNQDDYNDLYTFFMEAREGGPGGGTADRTAYCGGWLWVADELDALLWFSANDRGRVWVNGDLAFEQSETLEAMRDTVSAPVGLNAGWNRVVAEVENERRNWGFYLRFTDSGGKALEGVEWALTPPHEDAELVIQTSALPKAYNGQPYVWLTVRNPSGRYPWDNASASPLRLMAHGGTPPYSWSASGLPDGIELDAQEGEFVGRTDSMGLHDTTLTVRDASEPPRVAVKTLRLDVVPRPTEEWWEGSSRVGGLRHHGEGPEIWTFDHAEEQIDYMTRIGYAWQAYTFFSKYEVGPDGSVKTIDRSDMRAYRQALLDADIRFAQYMSFKDERVNAPDYKTHAENMHAAMEQFMLRNKPVLWFLDEMYGQFRGEGQETVEFDAFYSLIRTLDPSCLITVNAEVRSRDYEVGDLDLVQVHGAYKVDSYWGQWPAEPPLGNSAKYLPMDSWKFPWKGYMDPEQWCRALVTMLCEPANARVLRAFNLDPTPFLERDYHTVRLLRGIADWMETRHDALFGVRPLDVPPADWGYAVVHPKRDDVYLHILSNPRGKRGLHERSFLNLDPFAYEAVRVQLFPGGEAIPFAQEGTRLSIDVRGLSMDPVDTIIHIETRKQERNSP